jgi:hypothetical protein
MEPLDEFVQINAGELPFKGFGDKLVMTLETLEALGQHSQGVEVVLREHFSLNDRQVDLDLVEPTGVDGAMDHPEVGVAVLQSLHTSLAVVGGAVVHNPEHPPGRTIGFLRPRLGHQAVTVLPGLAPPELVPSLLQDGEAPLLLTRTNLNWPEPLKLTPAAMNLPW